MLLGYKRLKKLLFYLVLFILLLLCLELIMNLGGYFYSYIHSNMGNPEIEEDAFRILFLGESTTAGAGAGVGLGNAYPAQVEKILQQNFTTKNVKSYNKGISTIETTAILRNLDRLMIKYKPHLVVIMAGVNDNFIPDELSFNFKLKIFLSKIRIYRLIMSIKDIPKIELESKYLLDLGEGDFRYVGGRPYDHKLKSFNPSSQVVLNLDTMVQTVHSYSSEIWFAGYLQPDAQEKVNPVLQKIAEENNITYVGDYPKVDVEINNSLFSGWHPSAEGHKIIAEKIAEKIIQEGIIN